jgi:hypothetical protein
VNAPVKEPPTEREVTFREGEDGDIAVVVCGEVPPELLARIVSHRRELVSWLRENGGRFPRTLH